MQIHELKRKTANREKKIVGRGGKRGKTAGRGTKGQNARAGHKPRPEIRDIIKKIPKMRGRGKNIFQSIQTKPVVINLGDINEKFESGASVTPQILIEKSVIRVKKGIALQVKLLGTGEISKKLNFEGFTFSNTAKEKIEKAGGTI
ncbi:MAG: uL15 family ribosomal protein, partial [Candidatus Omnitrophota bacterium]|nr:uL15 family ribosomal protein [Candidatus Omnitrophota bacterium]